MSYDTILAKSPSIIFQPGGTPGENRRSSIVGSLQETG